MKPIKPLLFWVAVGGVSLVFVVLFGLWTYIMVARFHEVSSVSDPSPSPAFDNLKVDDFKRLFPE